MVIIIVNLYNYVTPISSFYNIQTEGRDIHSPLLLNFKTSKKRSRGKHSLSPSLSSLFSPSPPYPLLASLFKLPKALKSSRHPY